MPGRDKKYAKANVFLPSHIIYSLSRNFILPSNLVSIGNQIEFSTAGKVISMLFAQGAETDVACFHRIVEHHFLWFTATFQSAFLHRSSPFLAVLAYIDFIVLHLAVRTVGTWCVDESLHVLH